MPGRETETETDLENGLRIAVSAALWRRPPGPSYLSCIAQFPIPIDMGRDYYRVIYWQRHQFVAGLLFPESASPRSKKLVPGRPKIPPGTLAVASPPHVIPRHHHFSSSAALADKSCPNGQSRATRLNFQATNASPPIHFSLSPNLKSKIIRLPFFLSLLLLRSFLIVKFKAPTPKEAVAFNAMNCQDPPNGGDDDQWWQNDLGFTAPGGYPGYDVNPQTVSSLVRTCLTTVMEAKATFLSTYIDGH